MKRATVLHLHEDLSFGGGAEVYLEDLVRRQRDRGAQVQVLETLKIGPSELLRRALKADLIHLHGVYYRTPWWMLAFLRALRPTLLTMHEVAHFCHRRSMTRPSGEGCLKPTGWSCRKQCGPFGRGFYREVLRHHLKRALLRRMPLVLCPSRFVQRTLRSYGFKARRLKVLPLYLPIPEEWNEEKLPQVSTKGPLRILFVGRATLGKGYLFLKEVLARTPLSFEALAVGAGKAAERYPRGALRGLPPVSRRLLRRPYKWSQVLVMPSLAPESFGLTGLEAAFFGRAVLASRPGGPEDWLEDGKMGFLLPRGEVEAWVEALCLLGREREILSALSRRARETACRWRDPESHLDQLEEIYATLAS